MAGREKLLGDILRGTSDANIPFAGVCRLLRSLGFRERIRGDHHIRKVILRYRLGGEGDA